MEKGSKFKTILTTLLVLILMVGCVVLGYFVRDKEWIMIDNKNGATTLTVANVKYALNTIKEDFEKTGTDSNESGASGLTATTADSYFGLSTSLYKDMDEDLINSFYANEDISIASQMYDFVIKGILYMVNSEDFNIDGEIFEWTVKEDEWEWGLPSKYDIQRCKCTVNENNVIELVSCSYDTINDHWLTPRKMLINFDFADDSYAIEGVGEDAIGVIQVDPSAFPDDFDQLALIRFAGIQIKKDSTYENWDIDHCHLVAVQDYDLTNKKYCDMSDWGENGLEDKIGEAEHRRLVNKYFFDSKLVELIETVAEELGIEE